jgi:hypothetical protein
MTATSKSTPLSAAAVEALDAPAPSVLSNHARQSARNHRSQLTRWMAEADALGVRYDDLLISSWLDLKALVRQVKVRVIEARKPAQRKAYAEVRKAYDAARWVRFKTSMTEAKLRGGQPG